MPLTETELARFEAKLGRRLPADYRAFLLEHNGGKPSAVFLTVPGFEDTMVHVFCGIGTRVDLEKRMRDLEDDLPSGWIPIGFDPGGNVYLANPSGAVFYFDDHNSKKSFRIAGSFSAFLSVLREEL